MAPFSRTESDTLRALEQRQVTFPSIERLAAWAILVGLGAGIASRAAAQSPDGRFKLGIETAVFEYSSTTFEGAATATTNDSTDEVTLGVAPARAGMDFGYGLGDTWVLGARLLLVHSSAEQAAGGQDVDTTLLGLVPHLDYVFKSKSSTRVFLGPMAGFGVAEAGLGPANDGSAHLFLFGVNFGAHIFATRGVSIDPRLALSYALGSTSYALMPTGLPTLSVSADVHVIAVSVLIGVSAWL